MLNWIGIDQSMKMRVTSRAIDKKLSVNNNLLKQLGIITTENMLKQYGYNSAMSEAEKVMIRYRAILAQAAAANGDMARTLSSPASQLRILSANFQVFKETLGKSLMPIASIVLQVANSIISAFTTIANAIRGPIEYIASLITQLLSLFGITVTFFSSSAGGAAAGAVQTLDGIAGAASDAAGGLGDVADAADGVGGAADGAGKKIKEMLGLASFDEIHSLNRPDSSGGSGGSGGGGGAGGSGGSGGGGGAGDALGSGGSTITETEGALSKVSDKVIAMAEKIKAVLLELFEPIKAGWDNISPSIFTHFDELLVAVKNLWRSIKDLFVGVWENGKHSAVVKFGKFGKNLYIKKMGKLCPKN